MANNVIIPVFHPEKVDISGMIRFNCRKFLSVKNGPVGLQSWKSRFKILISFLSVKILISQ